MSAKPPINSILARALPAAKRSAGGLRERLVKLAGQRLPALDFLERARRLILQSEPDRERILSQSLLAAYFQPSETLVPEAIAKPPVPPLILPAPLPTPFAPPMTKTGPIGPLGPPKPPALLLIPSPESGPEIRFPMIERAAQRLYERQVFTRQDFDNLGVEAKRQAFTVARVQSLETLGRLQDLVGKATSEGHTLREFQRGAADVLANDSPLTDAHIETVFRTNLATNYSVGQRELLEHPLIADEFPYVLWTATHDTRTRKDHLAMEKAGLNGTAVYRRDDPLLRSVWPPAGFNCRCHVIPLQREDAARYGVHEAQEWLRTGERPERPAWVKSVPIELPAGWASSAA